MTDADLKKWDSIPPPLVLALANNRRGISIREVARRSGLSVTQCYRISQHLSWGGVSLLEIIKFTSACGVDLMRQKSVRNYLRAASRQRVPLPHVSGFVRRRLERLAA